MIEAASARRSAPVDGRDLRLAIAAPALVLLGYYVISDLRVSVAAVGALTLAAWGAFAFSRPRAALSISLPLLLLAGTKFRLRLAEDTLDGVLDAQILFELLLFAFIGVAVLAVFLTTRTWRRISTPEALIAVYTTIALISTLWSAEPALTLVRAVQLAIVGALAIVSVRFLTPGGALWTTVRALAVYVLVCALIAVIAPSTTMPLLPEEDSFRFRWFAVHPLDAATLAGAAALGVLGVIAYARTHGVPTNAAVGMRALFLALLVVLVLASSRGPIVALAAGIGLLWLIKIRPAFRAPAVLFASAGMLVCLVYMTELRSFIDGFASHDSIATRMFFREQTVDEVFALNGRLELWQGLGPIVADHLVMGTGYQASRAVLLDVAAWAAYAHNALLQTVLDLGAVGLLSMLGLILLGFYAGFRRSNAPWVRATVPALALFLTLNSMSNESFSAAPDVELLLVFLCALCGAAVGHGQPRAEHRQASDAPLP
jgi:exopolysaccharide production protein ExoQ